jgi:hypothetical protein
MKAAAVERQDARAPSVAITEAAFTVGLGDGRTVIVPLVWSPRLWHGTPGERGHGESVGESTYVHGPALDEDCTVAGRLAGRPSGESPQARQGWLEARAGQGQEAHGTQGRWPAHASWERTARSCAPRRRSTRPR